MATSELEIYECIKNDDLVRAKIVSIAQDDTQLENQINALLYLAAAAVNRQPYLVPEKPEAPGLW